MYSYVFNLSEKQTHNTRIARKLDWIMPSCVDLRFYYFIVSDPIVSNCFVQIFGGSPMRFQYRTTLGMAYTMNFLYT